MLEKSDLLKKLEQVFKNVETELSAFQSTLTTSEAKKKKDEVLEIVTKLETKLSLLSENEISITKTDRDKIEKQYETVSKAYRKRKRICLDILNAILEHYPKTKGALIEEIGMEMEEDNNIVAILKS
jgi:26S proteasome regulatory subunit (ATPase 3-interacting protein)